MKRTYLLLFVVAVILASCSGSSDDIVETPEVPDPSGPVSFGNSFNIINDTFEGTPIIVAGNKDAQIMVSFERTLSNGSGMLMELLFLAPT